MIAFLLACQVARSAEELAEAVAKAAPGAVVKVADGEHAGWKVDLTKGGAAGAPVVIEPETPKGVTFRGASSLRLSGDHLILRGFRFEGTGRDGPKWCANVEIVGDHNRVTDCEFVDAAGGTAVYTGIVFVTKSADEAELDHLTFRGSRTISVKVAVAVDAVPKGTRIHHNLFEDIQIAGGNGGEAIQLGSGGRATDAVFLRATVEHNVLRRVRSDPELISNKSSGNVIRFNRLYDSEGEIVLRGGDACVVEGNLLVRCDGGIRICGRGHRVVNNVVLEAKNALFLTYGGQYYDPARDCVIAHNTFHSKGWGLTCALPKPSEEEKNDPAKIGAIENNTIVNNIFVVDTPKLLRTLEAVETLERFAARNEVARNVFWRRRGGDGALPALAERNVFADPRLVLDGDAPPGLGEGSPAKDVGRPGLAERDVRDRPRGERPDLGAVEVP